MTWLKKHTFGDFWFVCWQDASKVLSDSILVLLRITKFAIWSRILQEIWADAHETRENL